MNWIDTKEEKAPKMKVKLGIFKYRNSYSVSHFYISQTGHYQKVKIHNPVMTYLRTPTKEPLYWCDCELPKELLDARVV